ncbi:DUF885 domain-containing protein [Sphingosinicella rhizophila]|uniref:DUF885 domain-containing protein n=1 Tax=Sphingosinicella rhizophila TaxID=3050082 RepID=A0ABU3QC96_9SPHN|nr:DUF885 domain-containing protein [Sphingosinicella sp. GR2756]MDT9601021.1 DUF885 domain-containing protein [Sphingosinicella sp. GR2756]
MMSITEHESLSRSLLIIDQAWTEMRDSPWVRRDLGLPIERLPDIGEAASLSRSEKAKSLLARADGIDVAALPKEIALTLGVARAALERMAKEGEWYWVVFDPLGVGFFAIFAPCSYGGGFLLNMVGQMLAQHRFDAAGDLDRYLGLIEDYGRMIGQMRERTEGQAARSIRMPKLQLDQSLELVRRFAAQAESALVPAAARLGPVGGDRALAQIAERVRTKVKPNFDALLALLDDPAYRAAAPDAVGIGQYPGGPAVYAELVRQHTTLDLTPEQVHEEGLKRIAAVRAKMVALLEEIDFDGTPEAYLESLADDPDWRAEGDEAIGAVFHRYIDRIAPHIDDYFAFKPSAPHGVEPLPKALSGSMTFGYYDAPSADNPTGRYLFNADNLAGGPLANIAALNYHELVPGHHFHLASQRENKDLHPLRSYAFINAFNEGWAEYAATLAGEMGMYAEPAERFGRLVMDSFLTTRLVVDTGMNALGWCLEQARDYMRANAFMPETEIRSESLRYSCDIPGQSLAYKLGEYYLFERREEMRAALGDSFDIRAFHDAVLMPGALPLTLVGNNVADATRTLAAKAA